nr:hypothetical protein [Halomonas socia]
MAGLVLLLRPLDGFQGRALLFVAQMLISEDGVDLGDEVALAAEDREALKAIE